MKHIKTLLQIGVAVAVLIPGLSSCIALQGDYPAPALGITTDENFQVLDIKKGSAAEEAGIQVGDVLLCLNGKTNLPPDEWIEILGRMEVGQEYEVTVQRGGETIPITVIARRDPPADIPPGTTATPIPTDQFYVLLSSTTRY